jgi:hypothetical protein
MQAATLQKCLDNVADIRARPKAVQISSVYALEEIDINPSGLKLATFFDGEPGFRYNTIRRIIFGKKQMPKGDGIVTCYYCGKDLTDPMSQARGCDPECIKNYGPLGGREWMEEYAKAFAHYCNLSGAKPMSFIEWYQLIGRRQSSKLGGN